MHGLSTLSWRLCSEGAAALEILSLVIAPGVELFLALIPQRTLFHFYGCRRCFGTFSRLARKQKFPSLQFGGGGRDGKIGAAFFASSAVSRWLFLPTMGSRVIKIFYDLTIFPSDMRIAWALPVSLARDLEALQGDITLPVDNPKVAPCYR